jgi:AcrR family transcriptional regulator
MSTAKDAIVTSARRVFGTQGYERTQLEQVARLAGVTIDTLLSHFKTKKLLFEAVFSEVHMELVTASSTAAARVQRPIDMFVAAFDAYLDAMVEPAVQRIAMLDAVEVLGFARFNELDEKFTLGPLTAVMKAVADEGRISVKDPENVARLLLGAVTRGAMHIARAPNPVRARVQIGAALKELATGIIPEG